MSRRQRREVGAGLAVAVLALAGAYGQAARTDAFARDTQTGHTLRLVCPLH